MSDFNYLMICEKCQRQVSPQKVPYKGGSCYLCWPPATRGERWIHWWRDEFLAYYQQVQSGSRNQGRTIKDTATRVEQVLKSKNKTLIAVMVGALADAYVFKTDRGIYAQWYSAITNSIRTLAAIHKIDMRHEDLSQ